METRPIKELLQIMLDNIDLLDTGLCGLTIKLYTKRIINIYEAYELKSHINIDSIPITSKVRIRCMSRSPNRDVDNITIRTFRKNNRKSRLYWLGQSGNKANRILYLKEQISLLNT